LFRELNTKIASGNHLHLCEDPHAQWQPNVDRRGESITFFYSCKVNLISIIDFYFIFILFLFYFYFIFILFLFYFYFIFILFLFYFYFLSFLLYKILS